MEGGGTVTVPDQPVEPKPVDPPYNPPVDPYTHVTDADGLTAALAGSATMIQIDGTIGGTSGYTAYHVARPVTINGGSVYGSFIITVPGVTVQNVNMYTQGGSGPLKNCIDAFTNAVTITGCTFNLSARTDNLGTTYLGNGIVVWPHGDAAVAVNISGNTFNELKSAVPDWASSAIQVVEALAVKGFSAYGIPDGTTMASIDLPNEDAIAAGNTYNECDVAYVHSNWTAASPDFKIYEYTYAETATQFADGLLYAVANGATVKLGKDITVAGADYATAFNGKTVDIDLAQHTLTFTRADANKTIVIGKSGETAANVTFRNGTINANNTLDDNQTAAANFQILSGCAITLDAVTLNTTGTALFPMGDAAAVTVRNSTITSGGVYGIATNAAKAANGGVAITVENSTVEVKDLSTTVWKHDNCAILLNVPGTMTITDSHIKGEHQGLAIRAGTVTVSNTDITAVSTAGIVTDAVYTKWGSGTSSPAGALVVGKNDGASGTAYLGNILLTLDTVTLSSTGASTNPLAAKYCSALYADNISDSLTVTITGSATVTNGNAVIKGEKVMHSGLTGIATILTELPTA